MSLKRARDDDSSSGRDAPPSASQASSDPRPVCYYDPGCTRQNLMHFADFRHPALEAQQARELGLADHVDARPSASNEPIDVDALPSSKPTASASSTPNARTVFVFRLNRVRLVPASANADTWSIQDLIHGDIDEAILSNFEVDLAWLYDRVPLLRRIRKVTLLHGLGQDGAAHLERTRAPNMTLYAPQPLPYGTHHSKVILLVYAAGIRVVVCTANFVESDWELKTEAIWAQDFPRKTDMNAAESSFERDLVAYFRATRSFDTSILRRFDYSRATAELVGSTPGTHVAEYKNMWGHAKLRQLLARETVPAEFSRAPVVCQFSSLGALTEKWIDEMLASFTAGAGSLPSSPVRMQLVFPTVESVRCSTEGYLGGCSIPVQSKNHKPFMRAFRGVRGHVDDCVTWMI